MGQLHRRFPGVSAMVGLSIMLGGCEESVVKPEDTVYSVELTGVVRTGEGSPVSGAIVEGWTHQANGWDEPIDTDTTDSNGQYRLLLQAFGDGSTFCIEDSARIQLVRTIADRMDTLRVEGIPVELCTPLVGAATRDVAF